MKTIIVAFFISAIAVTAIETETNPAEFVGHVKNGFNKFTKSVSSVEHKLLIAEHRLEDNLEGGVSGIN